MLTHALIEWQCHRCGQWVSLDESHAHSERRIGERRKGDRRGLSDRRRSTDIRVLPEQGH
jgi:hypothetical protein